jgi:hypothetical protein
MKVGSTITSLKRRGQAKNGAIPAHKKKGKAIFVTP